MTPPQQERPARLLDTTRDMSAEKTKAAVDEAALVLKTVYWSVSGTGRHGRGGTGRGGDDFW